MLKRTHRLPAAVRLSSPTLIHTPLFTLRMGPNALPVSRFGFVISKRVAKQAVVRNRTKRVLRSCIETMLPQIVTGFDCMFILKQPAVGKDHAEVLSQLKIVLDKQQLLI